MNDLYFKVTDKTKGIQAPRYVTPPTLYCECGNVTDGHPYGCMRCRAIDGDDDRSFDLIQALRELGSMTTMEVALMFNFSKTWAENKMKQMTDKGLVVKRLEPAGGVMQVSWRLA